MQTMTFNLNNSSTWQTNLQKKIFPVTWRIVDEEDIYAANRAVKSLMGGVGESYEIETGKALVCTVGEGLGNTKGVAARVFKAVASKDVNVELISAGASTVAYHFTVGQKDLKRTVVEIHKEFFGYA